MQTEVVHSEVSWRPADPADETLVVEPSFVPVPPGTSTISGSGRSSYAAVASIPSMPLSLRTTPGSRASHVTLAPGSRDSTS